MKIVINKCYGGFGISVAALKELVKLNSDAIESFTPKNYYGGESENYKNSDKWEESWKDDFKDYKHIGDGFMADGQGYNIYKDGLLYSLKDRCEYEMRANKDLVSVVEKMGTEIASASLAKLAVVEIPDDVEWEISDYDGIETIREKHRTW